MSEKHITYMRVPLVRLIEMYSEKVFKPSAEYIGHAFDARKDEVIIELMVPASDGLAMKEGS